MVPTINKADYSSYRVPFIDEFVPGFEYEYVHFSTIKSQYRVGESYKVKHDNRLECKILHIYPSGNTADVEFNCYIPSHCNSKFEKLLPLKTQCYSLSLLEEPCKITHRYWRKGIVGSPSCMGWGADISDTLHLKKIFQKRLNKGELITKGTLLSYHNSNENNKHPWIVVTHPDSKYYCFNKILINKMKTHQEYLDSLKQEKESSASFWSSIKKNLEATPMKSKKVKYILCYASMTGASNKAVFDYLSQVRVFIRKHYYCSKNKRNIKKINWCALGEDINARNGKIFTESGDLKYYHLTKSQITNLLYEPPKKRTFQVSYARTGFNNEGMPSFQITDRIYGVSVKAALRKHKIGYNKLLWIKEIANTLGIVADPKTIILYQRQLPINTLNKLQKRRYKATAKRNERKFFNTKQHVKDIHASDRLVCIRFKDTTDFKRVRVSETKDGTFNMSDWHYTSKSKYKEFTNLKEFIEPPKFNNEKMLIKGTRNIEKKTKHVKAKREEELIKLRKRRDKGLKKVIYRFANSSKNYARLGGKKSKFKNNRNVSIKITKTRKRREINEGKKKS